MSNRDVRGLLRTSPYFLEFVEVLAWADEDRPRKGRGFVREACAAIPLWVGDSAVSRTGGRGGKSNDERLDSANAAVRGCEDEATDIVRDDGLDFLGDDWGPKVGVKDRPFEESIEIRLALPFDSSLHLLYSGLDSGDGDGDTDRGGGPVTASIAA